MSASNFLLLCLSSFQCHGQTLFCTTPEEWLQVRRARSYAKDQKTLQAIEAPNRHSGDTPLCRNDSDLVRMSFNDPVGRQRNEVALLWPVRVLSGNKGVKSDFLRKNGVSTKGHFPNRKLLHCLVKSEPFQTTTFARSIDRVPGRAQGAKRINANGITGD